MARGCWTRDHSLVPEPFEIRRERAGRVHRLTPTGELDIATTPILERAFDAVYHDDDAAMIVLDLTQLSFMDSTGIGALLRMNVGVRSGRSATHRQRLPRGRPGARYHRRARVAADHQQRRRPARTPKDNGLRPSPSHSRLGATLPRSVSSRPRLVWGIPLSGTGVACPDDRGRSQKHRLSEPRMQLHASIARADQLERDHEWLVIAGRHRRLPRQLRRTTSRGMPWGAFLSRT